MNTDNLIQLVRTARGLEAGGFYNIAKLIWAMVYSQEIQASNDAGIPRGAALDDELSAIIDQMKAGRWDTQFIMALEKGRESLRADKTVPYDDIPGVYVSRTSGEIFLGEPPEFTSSGDHRLGLREFSGIWYFDPLSPKQALDALTNAPDIVDNAVSGLSGEQLLKEPAPGEWSMRDLLWHLYQAQEVFGGRIDKLLAEDNPKLEAAAVWAYEKGNLSAGDILERYRASREHTITRLKAIQPADWERPGWHSEFGAQTVLSQANYFARHEMGHMPQFTQIRQAVT